MAMDAEVPGNRTLDDLLAWCAEHRLCVKVGTWCAGLITQPGGTLPLIPRPVSWHAAITRLKGPTQWGATYHGWGDDPTSALVMAMERCAVATDAP